MFLGYFCDGSSHALITSRMKRLYRLTNRVSTTLPSRLAKHSVTRGGVTFLDGLRVQSDGLKFVAVATGAVTDPTTRPLVLTRFTVTWRHFMPPVEGGILSRPPSDE